MFTSVALAIRSRQGDLLHILLFWKHFHRYHSIPTCLSSRQPENILEWRASAPPSLPRDHFSSRRDNNRGTSRAHSKVRLS